MQPSATILVACLPPDFCRFFPALVSRAIVVSERLVREGLFTSGPTFRYRVPCREFKIGPEEFTRDIPGVEADELRHLDVRGLAPVGTVVRRGERLIGKVSPMILSEVTYEQKILYAVFSRAGEEVDDKSLFFDHRDEGVVSSVQVLSRRRGTCPRCGDLPDCGGDCCRHCGSPLLAVQRDDVPRYCRAIIEVEVSVRRELRVGDVLQDGQGNDYTVAAVVPEAGMPRIEGRLVDVMVTADAPVSALLTGVGDLQFLQLSFSPRTARWECLVWKKRTLLLEEKLQARAIAGYDDVTQMPQTELLEFPGQLVTPELASTLLRAGYLFNLAELLTVKADVLDSRAACGEAVRYGGCLSPHRPEAALRLQAVLRAAGFTGEAPGESFQMVLATPADVEGFSGGEVRKHETINDRTYRPESGGLFCERAFGPERDWECACGKYRGMKYKDTVCDRCGVKVSHSRVRRRRLGYVRLARPVVHPWFVGRSAVLADLLGLGRVELNRVIGHEVCVVASPGHTGRRVGEILFHDEGAQLGAVDEQFEAVSGAEAVRWLLRQQQRPDLEGVVLERLPVLPADLRPAMYDEDTGEFKLSRLNKHYQRVLKTNKRLQGFIDAGAPEAILRYETRLLQNAVSALFGHPAGTEQPSREGTLVSELRAVVGDLFRKTTDYSARAVVIPDPEVPSGKIGLPRRLASTLYAPLVAGVLRQTGFADSDSRAQRLAERQTERFEVREALATAIASRPLLVVTDALCVTSFEPVLVDGEALRLNPDDGRWLGLSYAGDQLTLLLPLTAAAVRELRQPTPTAYSPAALPDLSPVRLVQGAVTGRPLPLTLLGRIALGATCLLEGQPVQPVGFASPPGETARPPTLCKEEPLCCALQRPLAEFKWSLPTRKGLQRAGLTTVGELVQRTADELLDFESIGLRALKEIRNRLASVGMRLKGD